MENDQDFRSEDAARRGVPSARPYSEAVFSPASESPNDLDATQLITQSVLSNPKYRDISESFVADVAKSELLKRKSLKDAIKGTKSKLHQVAGAYIVGQRDYDRWLRELEIAHNSGDSTSFQRICLDVMGHHSSTKERVPFLQDFYASVLSDLGPVHSVLDIACGLNPLAIPWMPLAPRSAYYAYDIYGNLTTFLEAFFKIVDVEGHAQTQDVIKSVPGQRVDVALVLKTLPCLEQVDKTAGYRLLESINAETIVVSFPLYSLGGKRRGMAENYVQRFHELTAGKKWRIQRFDFPTELVFRINK